jgi:hypothetical protein
MADGNDRVARLRTAAAEDRAGRPGRRRRRSGPGVDPAQVGLVGAVNQFVDSAKALHS